MAAPGSLNRKSQLHIDEAHANYQRYELLLAIPEHRGWACVLLFYSALHLVEAYKCVYHPDERIDGHEQRDAYIYDELFEIHAHYKAMYELSRNIRYKLRPVSVEDARRLHDDHFAQLRKFFRGIGFAWQSPNSTNPTQDESANP